MGEGERFIFHVQKWINQDFRTIYLLCMYVCCSLFFCVFEMIIQENREEK